MRRKWWWVVVISLIVIATLGVLRNWVQPSRKVSVTFLCYTQDQQGWRREHYRIPFDGPDNMALFRLEKHGDDDYGYSVRAIEMKLPTGWTTDTNAAGVLGAGLLSSDPMLAALAPNVIDVLLPRPLTPSAWRCRVEFIELPRRGGLKAKARNWMSRFGLYNPTNFTRFQVASDEIEK